MKYEDIVVGAVLEQVKAGNWDDAFYQSDVKGRYVTIESFEDGVIRFDTEHREGVVGYGTYTSDYLLANFERVDKKEKQHVEINIGENDLDMFREMIEDNETVTWSFKDQHGEYVLLEFMNDDEFQQRRQ